MSSGGAPSTASTEDGASADDADVDALLRDLARAPGADAPAIVEGQRVDRFRVERLLGRGGMGAVYLAWDERLSRHVALKVLHERSLDRSDRRRRFLREARAAAAIQHPEVARILEVGESEGRVYLVFERVLGRPLRARLAEGPIPLPELLGIGRALCRALDAAHRAGVVHRDLKPENVMLTDGGGLKVLDFGLAQRISSSSAPDPASDVLTAEGQVLGSPGYMSPEQALGRATDHRADLFSLGVVLFELATGRRPFSGGTAMETIVATSRDRAPDVRSLSPRLPARLARLVASCLATDRERRPESARLVEQELCAIERGASPRLARALGAIGTLALAAALFVGLRDGQPTAPPAAESTVVPGSPTAPPAAMVAPAVAPDAPTLATSARKLPSPPRTTSRAGSDRAASPLPPAPPAPPAAPPATSSAGPAPWRLDPSYAEQK